MKPLGQKPKLTNFQDCHPPKGIKNWWEDIGDENKAAARRDWKQEVLNELSKEDE